MGSWRNRLAQESYTLKVEGSNPSLPTKIFKIMVIEISDRHVQILVVVESVVVLNHTGNNHIIPEDHRFKPCMAHTTRTAEICALNISSKSWQAYFKVFSLHGLINMIVRAP